MKNFTDITFILDRSGSMSSLASDVVGGFETFVKDQRNAGENAALTLVQFDDQYEVVFANRPIMDAPTTIQFAPRGSTALLDAIGRTINDVGARLSKTPENDRPNKVLFIVMTDGYENASREFTNVKVKELVEHQKTKYQWDFVFLGANMDSFSVGGSMGVSSFGTVNFVATSAGVRSGLQAASYYTSSARLSHNGVSVVSMADAYEQAMDELGKPKATSTTPV